MANPHFAFTLVSALGVGLIVARLLYFPFAFFIFVPFVLWSIDFINTTSPASTTSVASSSNDYGIANGASEMHRSHRAQCNVDATCNLHFPFFHKFFPASSTGKRTYSSRSDPICAAASAGWRSFRFSSCLMLFNKICSAARRIRFYLPSSLMHFIYSSWQNNGKRTKNST